MEALKQPQEERDTQWLQLAHDLKSPLTALAVATARSKNLPPDERELIQQAVGRIQQIVVDVLNPRPSGYPVAWKPEMLRGLLNEKQLEFPNVRFRLEITVCGPAKTRMPAVLMNRVLSNLINNAAEANGRTGEVRIGVRFGQFFRIEIEDHGPGIPAEIRDQLGHFGVSSKACGGIRRGIGLHSAIQFVKQMNGELSVENRLMNGGTLVRLNFLQTPTK